MSKNADAEKRLDAAGGAAFPVETNLSVYVGLSRRDWFAGMWISGHPSHPDNPSLSSRDIASEAYRVADAMLKERDETQD